MKIAIIIVFAMLSTACVPSLCLINCGATHIHHHHDDTNDSKKEVAK